jgi:RNA polymerase-binding transcription factor DksA
MGMFDWVDFKMQCPVCSRQLKFQTKDRKEKKLEWVGYKSIKNFYGYCDCCGTSVHFYKIKNRSAMGITATYKMEVFEERRHENCL